MLAVAWSVGKLAHEDVLKIQKYLNGTLRMNESDKHSFNLYQEYAIEPMERRRLARRFAQTYTRPEDRLEVTKQIETLLPPDGQSMRKTMAVQEIKEALVEDQINLMRKVKYKLTGTPFPAKITDLGREAFLQEYRANPLFFRLKVRYGDTFTNLKLSHRMAEKLSLEMSLVSLVVYADQILLPEELTLITDYLMKNWELNELAAESIVTMALCRECAVEQISAFCGRYVELSTYDERQQVYLMLGKLARVDHHVTKSEQHVLESIAQGLDIASGVRRSVIGETEAEPELIVEQ